MAAKICGLIIEGKSLHKISKIKGMPTTTTIMKWLGDNPAFAAQYTRAKEEQADTIFDQMLDIADDKTLDAHDRRVRVDTRKWVLGKMKPKKYGDKQHLTHAGDPENPLHATDTKSDAELERIASGGVTNKPEQCAN